MLSKMIAPLIAILLILGCLAFWAFGIMYMTVLPTIVRLIILAALISVGWIAVRMFVEGIKELKEREKDDISKY